MAERRDHESPGPSGRSDTSAAREPGSELKEQGRQTAEQAKRKADELRAKGHEAVEQVKRQAEEQVDRRTSQMAGGLHSIVNALHTAAERLADDGRDWMADYTRQAAHQVDRVGGYLEDEDAPAMMADLEDMARSRPGTFVGTTFAAGLAMGRFLRSSRPSGSGGDGAPRSGSQQLTAPEERTGVATSGRARSRLGETTGARDERGAVHTRDSLPAPEERGT